MGILGDFIDGFIDGWNGQTEDSKESSCVASSNNSMTTVRGVEQPHSSYYDSSSTVISSIEQMQSFLSNLERSCVSTSVTAKTAIQSQMLVISNIQSPTLVDTAFDTLILNLRKSLKVANELEREELREVYSLMIQNYVFFMDAKYQAKVKANREEYRALLEQAGLQLSKSVGQVACLATGVPDGGVTIQNLFDEEVEHTSLISKIIKWWNKEAENAEAADNFMKSLFNIIKKLDKYHEIIGPSMLIAGLIDRYKNLLSEYAYSDAYNECQSMIDTYTPEANASIFLTHPGATISALVFTSLVDLIVWFLKGCTRADSLLGFEPVFPTGWVIAGLTYTALIEVRYMIKASKERSNARAIVQENTTRINQINQEYNNTLQEFERIQQYYEEVI